MDHRSFEVSWKSKLGALADLAISKSSAQSGQQRLVWIINGSIDLNTLLLSPYLQTYSKSGWSKGKELSIKKLIEDTSIKNIRSQADEKIIACVKNVYDQWNYKSEIILPRDAAFLNAIDHPHIYWHDDYNNPVKIIRKQPTLDVDKTQNYYILTLKPNIDAKLNLYFEMIHRNKIYIYEIDDRIRSIANIVSIDGIKIPLQEEKILLDTLTAITPVINIQSNLALNNQKIESVSSHSTINIHVDNLETFFTFSIYVQPFGEIGPTFRPGEGRENIVFEHQNQKLQTNRHLNLEKKYFDELLPLLKFNVKNPFEWVIEDLETSLELLSKLKQLEPNVQLRWRKGKMLKFSFIKNPQHFRININSKNNWFEINGHIDLENGQIIDLKQFLEKKQNLDAAYIKLEDGNFLTLTDNLKRALKKLALLSNHQNEIHSLYFEDVEECLAGMQVKKAKNWRDHIKTIDELRSFQPTLPEGLNATLRPYQIEGFNWLSRLATFGAGACLADDMGLGKSLQTIAILLKRKDHGPSLVIAPTSVCQNWALELQKFAPTLKYLHLSSSLDFEKLSTPLSHDIIITSYGLTHSNIEPLLSFQWSTLVLDEAQALKNADTQRYQSINRIESKFKILLTGTPIENNLIELWSLFKIINPGLFGTRKQFEHTFQEPIEVKKCQMTSDYLKILIRPYILRRLKKSVLQDLPKKSVITIPVLLTSEETDYYNALKQKSIEDIEMSEHAPHRQMNIITALTRLRQAASNIQLIDPTSSINSSKLHYLKKIIQSLQANNHKALIFSQFVKHLQIVKEYLEVENISFQYLDGSTPAKERSMAVEQFQKGYGDFFLISLKAGGFGLNLTEANYVIHLDPWWNPAVEDQATDRAHRIGQDKPITVYRLISQNTIEEKIIKLHSHKRQIADDLLNGADITSKMTTSQILELIRN